MNTEQELRPLPCPFCGGPARTFHYNGTTQATCAAAHVECAGSDVCAPVGMWNRRSSDEQAEVVGWVDWHGGECPVAHDATVEAKLRHGGPTHVARASGLSWKHGNIHGPTMDSDIVSYRVLASPPAVAAGGVTEEMLKSALAASASQYEVACNLQASSPESYAECFGEATPPELAMRAALTAALAVGDEGIREGENG